MADPVFNPDAFRRTFPEFASDTVYPTATINFWAGLAQLQVQFSVWGAAWINGVSLYTAHELVLAAENAKTAGFGGAPGKSAGIASSKGVGGATVSYDSASTAEKDAGYWNLTTYGKQFFRLSRLFGAGAIQL